MKFIRSLESALTNDPDDGLSLEQGLVYLFLVCTLHLDQRWLKKWISLPPVISTSYRLPCGRRPKVISSHSCRNLHSEFQNLLVLSERPRKKCKSLWLLSLFEIFPLWDCALERIAASFFPSRRKCTMLKKSYGRVHHVWPIHLTLFCFKLYRTLSTESNCRTRQSEWAWATNKTLPKKNASELELHPKSHLPPDLKSFTKITFEYLSIERNNAKST